MLSILLLELRFQIYSYAFSTDDEELIVLRAALREVWVGHMGLVPYSRLIRDPQYDGYRGRRRTGAKWPDLVEEAFYKALRWTEYHQNRLNGTHAAHVDEMIALAIYEFTGQTRGRKQVSSHIQHLRRMSARMPETPDRCKEQLFRATAELQEANMEDGFEINRLLGQIQNATFLLARRNQERTFAAFALTQRRRRQNRRQIQVIPKAQIRQKNMLPDGPSHSFLQEISRFAAQNERELSLRPLRKLSSKFLALSRVNKFIRTEVLQFIESHLSFDFTWDAVTLHLFCTHIKPIYRQQVRHMAFEFVEGHAPDILSPWTTFGTYLSANLPSLKMISLSLIPRDPTCFRHDDFRWGQQTEDFVSSLHDTKATVVLSLQWKEDCDYFESKYVGPRGWKCIQSAETPDESAQNPNYLGYLGYLWLGSMTTRPGIYELPPTLDTSTSSESEVQVSSSAPFVAKSHL